MHVSLGRCDSMSLFSPLCSATELTKSASQVMADVVEGKGKIPARRSQLAPHNKLNSL